jgi:predicted ester cyclase
MQGSPVFRRAGRLPVRRLPAAESNKKLIRFLIEEALNKGRVELADEHFAADYVAHIPGVPLSASGPDLFKRVIEIWRSAFEDWHMTIQELLADGDIVANRFRTTGTHTGSLIGIAPTGRHMVVDGMEMHRLVDGKVAESWISNDMPGILVQLGVLPPPPFDR